MSRIKSVAKKTQWGGARAGAGRKPNPLRASHCRRDLKRRAPVEIKMLLREALPSLQDPELYLALHRALRRARRHGLRLIDYAVFQKKISLLCEFKTHEELESSMKSVGTTMAIAVKRRCLELKGEKHNGPVFLGRYRMQSLSTEEKVIASQRLMLPRETKDFPFCSASTHGPIALKKLFAPRSASPSSMSGGPSKALGQGDNEQLERWLDFFEDQQKDPEKWHKHSDEAKRSLASPQFRLSLSTKRSTSADTDSIDSTPSTLLPAK